VRSVEGDEIGSDHFLVRDKICLYIERGGKMKKCEIRKWDIGNLNKKEAKEGFMKEVRIKVQNAQL
jgi:hypothetical protein